MSRVQTQAVHDAFDRCLFELNEYQWTTFVQALDNPRPPNAALRRLMAPQGEVASGNATGHDSSQRVPNGDLYS